MISSEAFGAFSESVQKVAEIDINLSWATNASPSPVKQIIEGGR